MTCPVQISTSPNIFVDPFSDSPFHREHDKRGDWANRAVARMDHRTNRPIDTETSRITTTETEIPTEERRLQTPEEYPVNHVGTVTVAPGETAGSGTRKTGANRQEVNMEGDKEVFAGKVGIAGRRMATFDIQMEESWMNKLVIIMVMLVRTSNKE